VPCAKKLNGNKILSLQELLLTIHKDGAINECKGTFSSFLITKVGYVVKTCWLEKKIVVASIGIVVRDWYYEKESTHAKNERFYVSRCIETMLNQL
jgi:hypothetical protein